MYIIHKYIISHYILYTHIYGKAMRLYVFDGEMQIWEMTIIAKIEKMSRHKN